MICHTYKCIFIHQRKCANCSRFCGEQAKTTVGQDAVVDNVETRRVLRISHQPGSNVVGFPAECSEDMTYVRTREIKYNPPHAKITIGVHTAGPGGSNACSPSC
jgi:hypothetical protein